MNKYDSVLFLKSPKLLSNIIAYSGRKEYPLDLPNIIQRDSTYSGRTEKVNKNSYKDTDFIDSKKTKNKSKKKIRNKINLDKDISHIQSDIDFTEIQGETLIRTSKNVKIKKDQKDQILISSNDLANQQIYSKDIYLNELLTVNDLALKLSISTTDIIKWLFLQGISVTMNQLLDRSVSTLVARHYAFNVLEQPISTVNRIVPLSNTEKGRLRAPVITLLGHVDHGKTSLLKAIRQDNHSIKEAGNITQSIGSYELLIKNNESVQKLIFLDTPGHEAFIGMRSRGADITDIIILVVAADDGLKPQTIESIRHIHSRNLPFVVAINKIDKPEANISRVKKQLLEYKIDDTKNITQIIEVSALNGDNIDILLDTLINRLNVYQLRSDPEKAAEGTILEAYLDKRRGPIAQLLIQNGSLGKGDFVVAGNIYGKVKAIYNSFKENVGILESTALADILCFTEVPKVGSSFLVVSNEKEAKACASKYIDINKTGLILNTRISLDDIEQKGSKTIIKRVNLIIKTSARGAIDAIINILSKVPQEKVQINLLMIACGEVSFKDINLANTSNSILLTFGLDTSAHILQYAQTKKVFMKKFSVIYDLIDYVKQHMLILIDVEYKKNVLGYGRVKSLFIINKGMVAGCFVESGKLKKKTHFQLSRGVNTIYVGLIDSLKRIKDDVDEVPENNECGLLCKEYSLWEVDDNLECYELEALEKTL